MTDETRRIMDKLDRNINDILFDLVEENETLEGQVDELREQVAKLAEKQNRKTVDVKLGGELIYRQAVLETIEDDTRLGMYSRFASNNDAQLFKQVVNEIPSVSVSENAIDKQIVLDMLEDINSEIDDCGFEYKHWREYIDSLPTVSNLGNLSKCFDGMPNGEVMNLVLRKIFPRTIFIRGNDPCHKIKSINYSEEWENAPYKAEKGGAE